MKMNKAEAKNILKHTGYIGNEVGVAFEVAIKSMEKLEKIEQIVNEVQLYEDCYRAINKIKEILKQE